MSTIKAKLESPLKDNDLSELTKNEIIYWSKQLRMSPSEMFLLSNEELEKRLSMVRKPLQNDETLKNQLENTKTNIRLRGDGKQIWSILIETAGKIQDILRDENEPKEIVKHERMKGGMNNPCPVPSGETDESCDCPNNPARANWPKAYSNATNYTLTFTQRGTEEQANSVTIEPRGEGSVINVATCRYSTPAPIPCLCPENPRNQQPKQLQVRRPVQQKPLRSGRPLPSRGLAEALPERIRRRLTKRPAICPAVRPLSICRPNMPTVSTSGTLLEDVTPPSYLNDASYGTFLQDETPPSGFNKSYDTLLEDVTPPSNLNDTYNSLLECVTPPSNLNDTYNTLLEGVTPPSNINDTYDTLLGGVTPPSNLNDTYNTLLEGVTPPSYLNDTYNTVLGGVTPPSGFNETYNTLLENVTPPSGYQGLCEVERTPIQVRNEPLYEFPTKLRPIDRANYRPRRLLPSSPICPPPPRRLFPGSGHCPLPRHGPQATSTPVQSALSRALPSFIRRRLQRPLSQRSPLRTKRLPRPMCPRLPNVTSRTLLDNITAPSHVANSTFRPIASSTWQDESSFDVLRSNSPCRNPSEMVDLNLSAVSSCPRRQSPIRSTSKRMPEINTYQPRKMQLPPGCSYGRFSGGMSATPEYPMVALHNKPRKLFCPSPRSFSESQVSASKPTFNSECFENPHVLPPASCNWSGSSLESTSEGAGGLSGYSAENSSAFFDNSEYGSVDTTALHKWGESCPTSSVRDLNSYFFNR